MKYSFSFLILLSLFFSSCSDNSGIEKPNIVWIMLEDWGYDLSCYGSTEVNTPFVDKLASQGVMFSSSFCTSPVCSPSRSAMLTGFHQNYIGANQHRTKAPGFEKKELPYGIKPVTHLLEEAGYFTCLMNSKKTDHNFTVDKPLFMGEDWSEREPGQPFFAQITFPGTHRRWRRDPENPIDENIVELPPYYPDLPLTRRDWANGLEAMQIVDREVGALLNRLDREELSDNTIVFLIGDNGRCMPRGKQFLYDGGIKVPIIVRWPGHIETGEVNDALVMTIDITATILKVAGIDPGYKLHGKDILGNEVKKREYIFAARDKMDDTYDAMRTIRSREYKLIHNLMPGRPYCQYNMYKEASYPVLALLNVLNLKDELTPEQSAFMADKKPEYELFDMQNDPYELNNLADDPAFSGVLEEMLDELNSWRKSINDQGVTDQFRIGGWPAKYPTRTLEEWEGVLDQWKPYVFRNHGSDIARPKIKTVYENLH